MGCAGNWKGMETVIASRTGAAYLETADAHRACCLPTICKPLQQTRSGALETQRAAKMRRASPGSRETDVGT